MTHTSAQEQQLSFTDAQHLLARQGYEMLDRFGHVHASRNAQEWHLCLITELASMPPTRLLARLDEALTLRVEHSIALSSLAHVVGAKGAPGATTTVVAVDTASSVNCCSRTVQGSRAT